MTTRSDVGLLGPTITDGEILVDERNLGLDDGLLLADPVECAAASDHDEPGRNGGLLGIVGVCLFPGVEKCFLNGVFRIAPIPGNAHGQCEQHAAQATMENAHGVFIAFGAPCQDLGIDGGP